MTIAIAVSVAEGLVLAADSRTARRGRVGNVKYAEIVSDHATKVFALTRHAAAATHGRSHLGGLTIAGVAERFSFGRPREFEDISMLVEAFSGFLAERVKAVAAVGQAAVASHDDSLEFLIAGYGEDGIGRLYDLHHPTGQSHVLSTTSAPNYHWRGQGDAITRLMKGVAPDFARSRVGSKTRKRLAALEYSVKLQSMSLRDAIDFAALLGAVAIGIDRFVSGTFEDATRLPLVGGPVTLGVVTPRGFRLLTR